MSGFDNDRKRLDREFEDALEGVRPEELRSRMERELSEASLTPALLCLLSSRAAGNRPDTREAAGIQFVHAGLDATRRVLDDGEAWENAGVEPIEEDMLILAADVLVTLGFEHLIDHYVAATQVVNTFGSEKAREMGATDPKERFEHEAAQFKKTYTTAVEVGYGGDAPEDLISLAESLAVADCLDISSFDEGRCDLVSAPEEVRRTLSLAEHGSVDGYEAHIAAIRGESALGDTDMDPAKGVEAQD